MPSIDDLLREIENELESAKNIKDEKGTPLSGQDLADFTSHVESAESDATSALDDTYYNGITPSEWPISGEWIIDDLAALASEVVSKYEQGEDKQGQADRLKTMVEKGQDAIDQVD